jgi:hypothetical protein
MSKTKIRISQKAAESAPEIAMKLGATALVSATGKNMSLIRLSILWLVIVACFASFGYFLPEVRSRLEVLESVVGFTGIGLGAASCIVADLRLVQSVRSQRRKKAKATLLLFVSSLIALVFPGVIMMIAASATGPRLGDSIEKEISKLHLFSGEHVFLILVASIYMFWIALGVLVFFATYILLTRPSAPSNTVPPNAHPAS